MKRCPFCAEEIQAAAIKCKHCGEWLKPNADLSRVTVGKSLRAIRKGRRMTLKQLFVLSGVQLATLSRMENDKALGTLKNYICIARALGLNLSELFLELEKPRNVL